MDEQPQAEWAQVEVFGHRRHYGRILDVERFGARMIRIDVPAGPKPEPAEYEIFETFFYGGAAIFSVSPLTEEACRAFSERDRPQPYTPIARLPSRVLDDDGDEVPELDEDNPPEPPPERPEIAEATPYYPKQPDKDCSKCSKPEWRNGRIVSPYTGGCDCEIPF